MKPGDLIKGKNRSYARSLYRIISIEEDGTATMQFVCLQGRLGRKSEIVNRPLEEFKKATKKEIYEDLGLALSVNLIKFVTKLMRSGRVQRSLD